MKRLYALLFVLSIMMLPSVVFAENAGVHKIKPEEVKAKMDKGENILILDVRSTGSYMGSNVKIKGAVRIDPAAIEMKYKDLPMDKEIITYCT